MGLVQARVRLLTVLVAYDNLVGRNNLINSREEVAWRCKV